MVVWPLDLSDFSSVKAFVDRYEKEGGGKLDILLENAGIVTEEFKQTKDGWETTYDLGFFAKHVPRSKVSKRLATNHLGTALLALLLIPTMMKTPASPPFPRVTIVASEVHFFVKRVAAADKEHILNTLNDKTYCTPAVMGERYNVSKRELVIRSVG